MELESTGLPKIKPPEVRSFPAEGSKENFVFVQPAPKLTEVLNKPEERKNTIVVHPLSRIGKKEEAQTITEKEGLSNLREFLDKTVVLATQNQNLEIAKKAVLLRENLAYIGEPEFAQAVQGIAQHLLDQVRAGKEIYLYVAQPRSELYVTIRILEELDYLTEESPHLRQKVHFSERRSDIATACLNKQDFLVVVADDFTVSGSRIRAAAGSVVDGFHQAGIPPETIFSHLEANLIAARLPEKDENNERQELRVFAYYAVPEYKDDQGQRVVFSGISATGSHSSTDYGYEITLQEFQEFWQNEGKIFDKPLPIHIQRPYETQDRGSSYKDPHLQKRWEKIQAKYGL